MATATRRGKTSPANAEARAKEAGKQLPTKEDSGKEASTAKTSTAKTRPAAKKAVKPSAVKTSAVKPSVDGQGPKRAAATAAAKAKAKAEAEVLEKVPTIKGAPAAATFNSIEEMGKADLAAAQAIINKATVNSLPGLDKASFADLSAVGPVLAVRDGQSPWLLGDWALALATRFPDQADQAMDLATMDPKRVDACKWVAGVYPPEMRHEKLSWTHHRDAAGLEDKMRAKALKFAEANGLSVADFREYIAKMKEKGHQSQASKVRSKDTATVVFSFKVRIEDKEWGDAMKDKLGAAVEARAKKDGIVLPSSAA